MNNFLSQEIINDLPDELKTIATLFKGREKDMAILSSIVALSACLPNAYGMYDSKKVFPNLFLMIIAPAASGKGVMNNSRLLLKKIHDKVYGERKILIDDCKQTKKSSNELCPPIQTKIIPANISSADLYNMINNAHCSGIMIESEADTLANMMTQDWGNFSDVLRKIFHHEPLSISRKQDDFYLDIEEPKLSLVLTGTPDQLKPLVKSKENGLFSRFIYYFFDEDSNWKNVFEKRTTGIEDEFLKLGDVIYEFYGQLFNRETELEFKFSENQQFLFHSEMKKIHDIILVDYPKTLIQNLKRHGLICFRIAMIFTLIRNKDKLPKAETLVCDEVDFNSSLELVKILLKHALAVLDSISLSGLSDQDENILFSLDPTFSRQNAIQKGQEFGVCERTMDDKLVQWRNKKAISKLKHGLYQRIIK
ncbi:DUF3987 domain-containing protein [Maribacter stanieri]|uniref:DUF3987 domain-containing protein n=1 Tax=Maribacter stanieri TaxID=440514 RepID=UPI002493EA4F|nr:DUF3987 domain-containing protein [Maribacter stanieri]